MKNRQQAKKDSYGKVLVPTSIISIFTPGDIQNTFAKRENIKDILFLCFDDIEYEKEKGIFMSENDAKKIVAFIKRCQERGIQEIWVHCDAGISRSAGVAAAIMKYLNNDDSLIFNNPKYCPNMYCYRLTLNHLISFSVKTNN